MSTEEEREQGELPEDDEMFHRRERERREKRGVGDLFRRAIENTVGSVQSTGTVSKEALQFVLQQGDKGKREVVRILATEVGEFLRHIDISSEVIKVLTSVEMDFSASVRFRHTGQGITPELSKHSGVAVSTDPSDSTDPTERAEKPLTSKPRSKPQ